MPKFAANLSMMFPEFEVSDRFREARRAGFEAVEFLQPYQFDADAMGAWLAENELRLLLINTPMGDVTRGDRGLAGVPGRESEFETAMQSALDFAVALSVPMIHVMAGVVSADSTPEKNRQTLIENIRRTADAAPHMHLMLEPLNPFDLPGYLYSTADEVARLLDDIARDNVFLQFDFYHLQLSQGNLGASFRQHLDRIGHVQFSSVPGRFEPQYGEVHLPFLFDLLDELGYGGWVGCEYRPRSTTWEGLRWAHPYGLGAR